MWRRWIIFHSSLVAGQKATSLLNLEICFTVTFTMTYFPLSSLLSGWRLSPELIVFSFVVFTSVYSGSCTYKLSCKYHALCHLSFSECHEVWVFLGGWQILPYTCLLLSQTQYLYHLVCWCKECLLTISHMLVKSKGRGGNWCIYYKD